VGSHAFFLQLQGAEKEIVQRLAAGDLEHAPVSGAERALLEFVRLMTLASYRITAVDVQRLRDAGWSDEQIAEAVYIAALFAFFNRVADAFGLEDPHYWDHPPAGMQPPETLHLDTRQE
jgi:alkylhydroperoxidase family enzyme